MTDAGQGGDRQGITELLAPSVAAARAGDHATAWRLTSEFGIRFWLVEADELPADLPTVQRTEFHVLRAAAADRMELHDDTVTEVRAWRARATADGDAPSAALALSSLCLVAMVVESDDAPVTTDLAPADVLLTELAVEIGNAGAGLAGMAGSGGSAPRHVRVCLSLAAMAGLTCATSTENTAMRTRFRELSARFTSDSVQPGDRMLTEAQQLHADGRTDEAVALVTGHLAELDPQVSPTRAYEAHDLLGYFALTAGEVPEDMDTTGVLEHWRACAEIALAIGAPLEGMHRAEQVCQLLNADGDYDAAHDLARRYSTALQGAPVSPALLNLRAVQARSALGAGLPDKAYALAVATADWSALTPDSERTLACLSIATMAAEEAGAAGAAGVDSGLDSGETVVALLERAATLHLDRGEGIAAAQVLRTAARERCAAGAFSRAVELMERARQVLEDPVTSAAHSVDTDGDMLTWHLADWNEDMSAVWEMSDRPDLAVGYAERAARLFRDAYDHSGAALNWVSAAELYLGQGDGAACDRALDLAHGELLSVSGGARGTDGADGAGAAGTADAADGTGSVVDPGEDAAWEGYHALRNLRQE
jgi:tetratricopeptide (TPR) repeat protein